MVNKAEAFVVLVGKDVWNPDRGDTYRQVDSVRKGFSGSVSVRNLFVEIQYRLVDYSVDDVVLIESRWVRAPKGLTTVDETSVSLLFLTFL